MAVSGVSEVLQETLRQLSERRRKLEPFVDELAELDIVERDLRKTVDKLNKRGGGRAPRSAAAAPAEARTGTHRERTLAVLGEHPQGLSGARIAELAGIQGQQIYPLLAGMASDGVIEKVGRGFYRLVRDVEGDGVSADLTEEEREELGDRAVA
jgi:hypothetical protein